MSRRYGGGGEVSGSPIDADQFRPPTGAFLVAWLDDEAVACAGVRALGGLRAELKRFFVAEDARRSGIGRRLLHAVEEVATELGYRDLWLETGSKQPEAIALYEGAGYSPIANYGEYQDEPGSRCFARPLVPRA